jgi:hypothetical protein
MKEIFVECEEPGGHRASQTSLSRHKIEMAATGGGKFPFPRILVRLEQDANDQESQDGSETLIADSKIPLHKLSENNYCESCFRFGAMVADAVMRELENSLRRRQFLLRDLMGKQKLK